MGTLVLEPTTDLGRQLRAERARLDTFLCAMGACETEHGRATGEDAAGWVVQGIAKLERERLASLRRKTSDE